MDFWENLSKELELWWHSIGTPDDCPEIFRDQLEEWLRARVREGDEACAFWIDEGRWPEMTPDLRWQVSLRMGKATMLALTLSKHPWAKATAYDREEALRWLLIEVWSITSI